MNDKFKQDILASPAKKEIIEKWEKAGFLEDLEKNFPNQNAKKIVATLLENQAQYQLKNSDSFLDKITLVCTRKIMDHIFSFQKENKVKFEIYPMVLPSGLLFWEENKKIYSTPIIANSRIPKALMPYLPENYTIDDECELTRKFSEDVAMDIIREIDYDLANLKENQTYYYCPYILLISLKKDLTINQEQFMMTYTKQIV